LVKNEETPWIIMFNFNLDDTIAAVATGLGESGIGIVRISGKDALAAADKVFISRGNKRPSDFETYTLHYGWIAANYGRGGNQEIIDEVLLTVMRAPKSFTREDVVEINCHGGIVATRAVLELVLENGCRLARPGEFTKRAFLNGRIDLAQAEAVADVIRAKTDSALKIGMEQLKGVLSKEINYLRDILLDVLSRMEAGIDFPEDEIDASGPEEFSGRLAEAKKRLGEILSTSGQGRILREGVSVVICGKPNAGKSSLLNALLRKERSIVTSVSGTTRDTIEEIIDIKGVPIRIVDTAGIIEPRDLVEKKAVQRSKKYISSADLVILLLDGSRKLAKEDELLIKKLKKKNVIPVVNKIDLKRKIDHPRILKNFNRPVEISAKKNINIDALEEAIVNLIYSGKVEKPESVLLSNLRHIQALKKAENFISRAAVSLKEGLSLEFSAQDIKGALGCMDDVLGKNFSGDLLEKIFSEFCIGK